MDDVDNLVNNADAFIGEANMSKDTNVTNFNCQVNNLEHNLHQSLFTSSRLSEEVDSLYSKMLRASGERENVPAVTMLNLLSS